MDRSTKPHYCPDLAPFRAYQTAEDCLLLTFHVMLSTFDRNDPDGGKIRLTLYDTPNLGG